jgi:hypothetical protein
MRWGTRAVRTGDDAGQTRVQAAGQATARAVTALEQSTTSKPSAYVNDSTLTALS